MESTLLQQQNETSSTDARRRQYRVMPVILAGAATVATLALFNAAHPGDTETVAAQGVVVDGGFPADPSNAGWTPQPDPGVSSQPDPGWNADPGWDFQPSP
jgi:hypothetical protein